MGAMTDMNKSSPCDIVPRIVPASDWRHIEAGLCQRMEALNLFIDDVYHDQTILKNGVIPSELIYSSKGFLRPCVGLTPPARHLVSCGGHRSSASATAGIMSRRQHALSVRSGLRIGSQTGHETDISRAVRGLSREAG